MNKIVVENDMMRFYSTPVPIPVGGSQWSKIFFMFSDEWKELRKIAQFRQGELKRNVDIASNNFCYVPNEMLPDMCGELSIVGYPQDTASAVVATANSLMLNFVQGFESGGDPAVPPTPDLYQKLLKEFAESGGGGVQPDWNQNDSTQPDYIKNRPFYTGDPVETVLVEESTVSFAASDGMYMGRLESTFSATVGETYKVYWDGAAYECACVNFNDVLFIGNLSIIGAGSDTGEPFIMVILNGESIQIGTADTSASHTVSISATVVPVVKIDEKYLPISTDNSYGVVKKADIVSAYKFPNRAEHDRMVDAITAFETGNASIVWHGNKVIEAYYDSSNDTISAVFAHEPMRLHTYSNNEGFYNKTLSSSTYRELQGNQVRIVNDEGAYAVLSTEEVQGDATLRVNAEKLSIRGEIGGYALVLKSSTAGSTKKFRITVDDSGTITATEVS